MMCNHQARRLRTHDVLLFAREQRRPLQFLEVLEVTCARAWTIVAVLRSMEEGVDLTGLTDSQDGAEAGGTVDSSLGVSSQDSRLTSDVYSFVQPSTEFTPQKRHKRTIWHCMCCMEHNVQQKWTTQNTSNFRYHLTRHHSDKYGNDGRTNKPSGAVKTMCEHCAKPLDVEAVTGALVDWIIDDSQSFRVVENNKFRHYSNMLSALYHVPARTTIRTKIIERWKDQKKLVAQQLLKDVGSRRVGITTDMWTSPANRGYMVVTMHYLDNNWEFRSVIIGFTRVAYPHTGARLADHLLRAVTEMHGVLLGSIWTITADNASNNDTLIATLNDELQGRIDEYIEQSLSSASEADPTIALLGNARKVIHLHCIAHVLQLAVKEGLKKCPMMHSSIAQLRDIVKKIKESPKLREALEEVCINLQVKSLQPLLDIETRWNSTWIMIERILNLKRPLEELLRRIRGRHEGYTEFSIAPGDALAAPIDGSVWKAAGAYYSFLQPFKEATDLLSGSIYPTLGMVAVVYRLIADRSNQSDQLLDDPTFAEIMSAIDCKLKKYSDIVNSREVKIAAALDPRIKGHLAALGIDVEGVKLAIITEYNDEYRRAYDERVGRLGSTTAASLTGGKKMPLLHSMLKERVPSTSPPIGNETFHGELNRWLLEPGMDISSISIDVCAWFRLNKKTYPRIELMARDFLGVTATSVPSEVAFSKAGSTISERRARLGDDAVQAICELQSFLDFIDKHKPNHD